MQLTVLVDNHTLIDRYFEDEAGLSSSRGARMPASATS